MTCTNNSKGFTLIELLVVISIIALLIAILMPALNKAREQATGSVCLGNQKALILAWVQYADDHDGHMVFGDTWFRVPGSFNRNANWVCPPYFNTPNNWWHGSGWDFYEPLDRELNRLEQEQEGIRRGRLWPYIKAIDVYHCPGDKLEWKNPNPNDNPYDFLSFRSYGINGAMWGEWSDLAWNGEFVRKSSEIKFASSKYVFVEEIDDRGWNMGSWVMNQTITGPNAWKWIDPLPIWHNERSTLSFADGHAEMHTWVDERTINASKNAIFNEPHPDSEDWLYMWRGGLPNR